MDNEKDTQLEELLKLIEENCKKCSYAIFEDDGTVRCLNPWGCPYWRCPYGVIPNDYGLD